MNNFKKEDGGVDERMEKMAEQIGTIYDCLLGKMNNGKPGLIEQVRVNTRFRKAVTAASATLGLGAVSAFITGKLRNWF